MVTATAVCCCRPTFCSAATAAEPSSKAIPALPASKAPRVRSRMEMHSSSVTVEGDGGRGITIDGVTATNGFQPLFTFIQAAMFRLAGGDDALAVRLILALHWLCQLGAALTVGEIAGDAVPGGRPGLRRALATFLYLAGSYLFLH